MAPITPVDGGEDTSTVDGEHARTRIDGPTDVQDRGSTTAAPDHPHPGLDRRGVTFRGNDAPADASPPRCAVSGIQRLSEAAPAELATTIRDAARMLHSSRYRLIRSLAAYDDSGHWAFTGAVTCAHWAAGVLGVAVGTAREWLRIGHALDRLPAVDTAMGDGRLSYCATRTLTRIAVDHPGHQDDLVALAGRARPGELARVLAAWAHRHDDDHQRGERERRDTHLSAGVGPDGMGVLHVRLPVIDLGRIQAAIDASVMRSRRRDHHPRPSLGRQRADALVALVTGDPDDGESAPSVPRVPARVETEVIVHVRSDGVTLHDGTPLADSVVAGLIDTAFVRMLIHDAENRPVNASVRRRHPTTRQRRVVDERHPRCVDCGGTELLEYDHEPPYSVTHRTHSDELDRRCPRCHALRHAHPPR